jgi:Pyridoxamine 5'-phosphate oxidase
MSIPLGDATLALLDGRNYAVLAAINPDGSPQTSVMWVGRDGNDPLFSTVEGRSGPAARRITRNITETGVVHGA